TIPLVFASAISLSVGALVPSVFALDGLVVFDSFDEEVCADKVPGSIDPKEKTMLKLKSAIALFIQFVILLLL
ncbi:MAG: hypothetical protein ACTHMB_23250, partial [Candidatus Binatia bacterium]